MKHIHSTKCISINHSLSGEFPCMTQTTDQIHINHERGFQCGLQCVDPVLVCHAALLCADHIHVMW